MSLATETGAPLGIVITVFRGACAVVHDDRVFETRLGGRHARAGLALAVGDEVRFDPERGVLLDVQPRKSVLARRAPRDAGPKTRVIAANMDRLAIVAAVEAPPFRPGFVDRLLLAAVAGGLEPILVVNKIDLLEGLELPERVREFEPILPVYPVSALTRAGLGALRAGLGTARTVLAGQSGVGKSALLNALEPELRLETREVRARDGRGRHTTSRATLFRLRGGAVLVDTPGVRELATGPVDRTLLADVFPEIAARADACRFRDCRHHREPDCAVRAAVERGEISAGRWSSFRKLDTELAEESP